jgi:two-component system sensor histidine kinase QseC
MQSTVEENIDKLAQLTAELAADKNKHFEPIDKSQYPTAIHTIIDNLNKIFDQLEQSAQRNKRFSADAAHELRTPLTAVKTQAQLALQVGDLREKEKSLENVLISANRSLHIIQQLLTLSKIDHEEKLNDRMPVHLESVCTEIIAYLYPTALEKEVEIEFNSKVKFCIIIGNDAALGIMARNIIDNAIRYTPPGGRVQVELFEDDSTMSIRVTDTGTGIPKDMRKQVFDRFFRVLGTKEQGSGLGLSIVQEIADMHRAQVKLQDPKDHQGLQIEITFEKPLMSEIQSYFARQ